MKQAIIGGVIIIAFMAGFMLAKYSTQNQEVGLRNAIYAQQQACKTYQDKMWKVISQKAQISDQYRTNFDSIYPKIISGRYADGGGSMMKWIKESNPNFDVSLYKDLSLSIEAERAGFNREQDRLIDLNREHQNLLTQVPYKWFLRGTKPIDIIIITSDKTEAVYATGRENDVDLFKK